MSDTVQLMNTLFLFIYFRRLRKLGYQVYFLIKMSSKFRRSFPDKLLWVLKVKFIHNETHKYKVKQMEVGFIWFSWCIYICSNVHFLGVNNTKKIMLWNILHCIKQYLMKKNKTKKQNWKQNFMTLSQINHVTFWTSDLLSNLLVFIMKSGNHWWYVFRIFECKPMSTMKIKDPLPVHKRRNRCSAN